MISLSAEQKKLESIYCTPTERYIVPEYQRPYSWTFEQCGILFRDIMTAFEKNEDSYFLGSIILARSKNSEMNENSIIIDGQQRLITLWTLIKVLAELLPCINTLKTALYVMPWTGNKQEPKIKSEIIENRDNDNDVISKIFLYSKDDIKNRYDIFTPKQTALKEDKCHSRIEATLLFFYEQITKHPLLSGDKALMDFSQFLMKRVMLLPIVQSADEKATAIDKALTIFETINNRGLNLEDADIFKAKLYNNAYKRNEKEEFINFWADFKTQCTSLNMSVDDIFRYYSHIIRGKEGVTTNEKRLREFFTNESYSPLKYDSYKNVLNDLSIVVSSLQYIKRTAGVGNRLQPGPWIQILIEYSNQYPLYAIVVYLFNHNIETEYGNSQFVKFLKTLVRYCLFTGSATSVKYGIYTLIKMISYSDEVEPFSTYTSSDFFNHFGRLRNCFALLAYLLEYDDSLPEKYSIDRIVNPSDEYLLGKDWVYNDINEICDSLGNLVVLDIPKRYISLDAKPEYYSKSHLQYVHYIFKNSSFEYEEWKKRDTLLKNKLVEFFNDKLK